MGNIFKPEKYNMAVCPLCNGKGRLPKNPGGFNVCKKCEGFGFIKRETGISEEVKNKEQTVKNSLEKGSNIMFKTMLVEDNSSFRQMVKNNLKDQFPSMDIIEAGDGIEAFQKIDSHHPNLIFMDIQLPGENGLELTRKIKADHPEAIVIILTSHDLPEYREAAIQNKANYFFSKDSIKADEIFRLVKSILLEKGFNADGSDSKWGYS
ncbi:MAG: response regulator receiver protein [Deltaproteobacteria bacterium]|jgi:CheY-like chemotaxis protein|nr:response regulator receiver protein [Deltaproteobacteria bacterium]